MDGSAARASIYEKMVINKDGKILIKISLRKNGTKYIFLSNMF